VPTSYIRHRTSNAVDPQNPSHVVAAAFIVAVVVAVAVAD
jgi:preprotein translocase subunit Sec61beta